MPSTQEGICTIQTPLGGKHPACGAVGSEGVVHAVPPCDSSWNRGSVRSILGP
jgi:hypothetical protein